MVGGGDGYVEGGVERVGRAQVVLADGGFLDGVVDGGGPDDEPDDEDDEAEDDEEGEDGGDDAAEEVGPCRRLGGSRDGHGAGSGRGCVMVEVGELGLDL